MKISLEYKKIIIYYNFFVYSGKSGSICFEAVIVQPLDNYPNNNQIAIFALLSWSKFFFTSGNSNRIFKCVSSIWPISLCPILFGNCEPSHRSMNVGRVGRVRRGWVYGWWGVVGCDGRVRGGKVGGELWGRRPVERHGGRGRGVDLLLGLWGRHGDRSRGNNLTQNATTHRHKVRVGLNPLGKIPPAK